ncbi:MAG TPA: pilus assembly PilX N-terminal domain-containing protein [Candidatus Acidoferrales bacterium]
MKKHREQGMALITALLVLMLVSSMIVGLTWMVMTDQKLGGNNADRQRSFYAAEAGMESMTAALAADFNASPVLSATDINNIMTTTVPANMTGSGIQYISHAANAPCGVNGYCITFTPDGSGNPAATTHTILTGQNAGLVGLLTPYTLQVTAMTPQGSEVKLQRVVQTAAIPIFQFGMFCYNDCDFFAGPDFSFGGRLHSNGNLWLAENGGTLTLSDKVTAAGEIIRSNLENGTSTTGSYNTTVNITTNPGSGNFAALSTAQGSESAPNVIGALSGNFWTPFKSLAASTYNSNIGVKETGILPLNVGIATPSIGGQSIDLIRMPVPGEQATNAAKLSERYYSLASLRILLSDYGPSGTCTDSDIVQMPNISTLNPVDLASLAWNTVGTNGVARVETIGYKAAGNWSLPLSKAASTAVYTPSDGYWIKTDFPIITGCIKVDYQNTSHNWVDVTPEILKLGLTGPDISPVGATGPFFPSKPNLPGAQVAPQGPTINGGVTPINCPKPSPNAVIRLARVRDNPSWATTGGCPAMPASTSTFNVGYNFWPNALYDTREGLARDNTLAGNAIVLSGAMNYVELDVANLAKWFTGAIGASGTNAINVTGYTVYFSDRRGDRLDNTAGGAPVSVGGGVIKTGAFGFEDFVDPLSANACPNTALDQGEDVEGDYNSGVDATPVLRTYGKTPQFPNSAVGVPITNLAPMNVGATLAVNVNPNCTTTPPWPGYVYTSAQDARQNPPLVFRRALKLVNGSTINNGICDTVQCGLTVAAENPVYVQGDYNAQPNGVLNNTYVAAAVIADAVTLLSDNFNDVNTFAFPYGLGGVITNGGRNAVTTTYRMAIIGGKGVPFPLAGVAGTAAADYGTDGGAHNFLRYIENWGGQNLWYTGSIVSLYYNHQAVGLYKCCNTVYSPPTRKYTFDTQFLTPNLLPPQTPMLRSVNTISMTQMDLSTQ